MDSTDDALIAASLMARAVAFQPACSRASQCSSSSTANGVSLVFDFLRTISGK